MGQKRNKKLVGYTPQVHQSAVHKLLDDAKGTGRIVVVKSRRQCGKSMLAENELLRWAINIPNSTNALISPTLAQSRKIFKELCKAIGKSNICVKKNESLLEIELINGSSIFFKSGEQRDGLRGQTISGILILDEAAYLDDEILQLVSPWTNVHRAPILMLSTPRLKSGFFFDYYMTGINGTNERIKSVDWNDYDLSIFLDKETLELYRKMMPKGQFETEYMGNFVDEGAGVFSYTDDLFLDHPANTDTLYIGIDFAAGNNNDYTVITALNDDGDQCLLDYCKDKTPLQQVRWLTEIIQRYKKNISVVMGERNSIGTVYLDMLKNQNPDVNIQEFQTSNTSKREIIESLQAAMGEKTIHLINDKEQKKELSAYGMEITKGGNITYNGQFGVNDDIVMADAFALFAKKSTYGVYCFG